jgi:hypothetical protein
MIKQWALTRGASVQRSQWNGDIGDMGDVL